MSQLLKLRSLSTEDNDMEEESLIESSIGGDQALGDIPEMNSMTPDIPVGVLNTSPEIVSPEGTSPPSRNTTNGSIRKKKLLWADDHRNSRPSSRQTNSESDSARSHVVSPERFGRNSYILYESKEDDGASYVHVKRDRTRSSFANSMISEGDINEDYDYRGGDFIQVEVPSSNPDGSFMTMTQELQVCKKVVLKPYLTFLKAIGWRSLFSSRQDITPSHWIKLINILYPTLIFFLLVFTCCTQVLTCFYRDQPVFLQNHTQEKNTTNITIIDCRVSIFPRLIFPDILLLLAYLWGLYIFRFGAPEHLITLVETVFLSSQHIRKGQVKMVSFMRLIMLSGFVWLLLDVCVSIMRVFSLDLLGDNSFIYFLSDSLSNRTNHTNREEALRFSFVLFTLFGFVFFDLLYIAIIVTYISQCQLIRLYISTIISKVLTKLKGYTLEQAMTDIHQTYKFLQVVNGKISVLITICLLVFFEASLSSLHAVISLPLENMTSGKDVKLGAAVGICNAILWSLIGIVPILQAARLTSRCQQLRRLGLSVGHRPFAYHNTPQLLLDSFVQYTSITKYRAKLAGIPMYPSLVFGVFCVLLLVVSLLVTLYPARLALWF